MSIDVRAAIRFPDESVVFITAHRHGGVIPNREGERLEVRGLEDGVVQIGRYTFTEHEAMALTSCLLSTLFAHKADKRGCGD